MTRKGLSGIVSILVERDGLRAGWRFLLFVLGIELAEFCVRAPLISFLARQLGIRSDELAARSLFIEELVALLIVLLVTGIAAFLERRRVDDYGLPVSQAFRGLFWKGMLAGLLVVIFVAGGMIATNAMQVHGLALTGSALPWFALLWLGANLFVGLNVRELGSVSENWGLISTFYSQTPIATSLQVRADARGSPAFGLVRIFVRTLHPDEGLEIDHVARL